MYDVDPQVAFDADSRAVAVWSLDNGSDIIVQSSSSSDGGVNWSTPVDLSATGGDAFYPQIVVDAEGTVYAIWFLYDGSNYIVQSSSSSDGGLTWSTPVDVSAAGGGAFRPKISVDAAGTVYAVWSRYDGSNYIVQASSSSDGGLNWSTPENVSATGGDANALQIGVDAAGTVYAIWFRYDGSNYVVQSSSSSDGGLNWSTPENVSATGGDAYDPQIAVDAAGTVYAIWTGRDGSNFIVQSSSSIDGGLNWSTPENVSATGGDAFSSQISVDAAGTVYAIWTRYDGSNNIVQSSSSSDGGLTWSTPVDLSATGGNAAGPQVTIDAQGTAIAIWYRYDLITNVVIQTSTTAVPSLPNTGTSDVMTNTALAVGSGLLAVGALTVAVLRRVPKARRQ